MKSRCSRPPSHQRKNAGFTLLEVLVATAVFVMMLGMLVSLISQTGNVTRMATSKITAFQSARAAFDLMAAKLSQATLNSYWDYDNPNAPTRYVRKSELGFVIDQAGQSPMPGTLGTGYGVAFQAPAGRTANRDLAALPGLLNEFAYYIDYGNDPGPFGTETRYRYRLMQACRTTETLEAYRKSGSSWVSGIQNDAAPIAENIVFIAAWPRLSPATDAAGDALTQNFAYDSRGWSGSGRQPTNSAQLPPLLQLTLVAIDEKAAARLCTDSTPPSSLSGVLTGRFTKSTAAYFQDDLKKVQEALTAQNIAYRIFSTMVPIRESKME